jgi:hypothetical protein
VFEHLFQQNINNTNTNNVNIPPKLLSQDYCTLDNVSICQDNIRQEQSKPSPLHNESDVRSLIKKVTKEDTFGIHFRKGVSGFAKVTML